MALFSLTVQLIFTRIFKLSIREKDLLARCWMVINQINRQFDSTMIVARILKFYYLHFFWIIWSDSFYATERCDNTEFGKYWKEQVVSSCVEVKEAEKLCLVVLTLASGQLNVFYGECDKIACSCVSESVCVCVIVCLCVYVSLAATTCA